MKYRAATPVSAAAIVAPRRRVLSLALLGLVLGSAISPGTAPARAAEAPVAAIDVSRLPPAATSPVDFQRDIQPLLQAQCVSCHGPEKQKGGLRLDSKAAALRGGDSGAVILPGQGAGSRLVHLVAHLDPKVSMPPKGEPLTATQVGLLRAWIDQGAVWPEAASAATRAQSEHWSLQPIRMPAVPAVAPAVAGSAAVANPIDAFVLARLAAQGLALSPPADRTTLIRRLSFDLTGLPPTPEEIDAFVDDRSPRAYEDLVDRLLASERYGERWGRHWLDIVRYTESQGFEYDKLRDNAWHYRDYVIRSFNADKPYDRFMREQVAGDAMEPLTTDGIIGASLLVCGPWDEAGNAQANATQRAITREEEMEDLIGVVGQTFLGLTVNCARCHSHKFDPIPQQEYYRLKAVFDGVKHGERPVAGADELKARDERIAALKQQIAVDQAAMARLEGEGWKKASARRPEGAPPPGPAALFRWSFGTNGTVVTDLPGELKGGATLAEGRLQLPKEGAHFASQPIPRDLREKTLEAWVSLADLNQGGGAAISIQTLGGGMFDAIVFGEREPRKWMAGSSGFERTRDLGAPDETTPPGALVHMAIVYRADNSIAVYRNGEPYGKPYTPSSPLQTYAAGKAQVLIGMRHTGGGRDYLTGAVRQASVYDRALSAEEVGASFRSAGFSIPPDQVLASLSDAERAEHQAANERIRGARAALDAMKPLPVSYTGVRVQPPPTKQLRRGDVKSPLEVVTPAALGAIAELDPEFGLAADAPEAQRRLAFASWLADRRNPLPARVMANRVWHFHFGQGLVTTPNDFGASGARPSHPALLDWLAATFIESGWSVKTLHRLIVNSATYRQSSGESGAGDGAMSAAQAKRFHQASALDADNQLLWRFPPHRLEAEAVRDAVLAVSGRIRLTAGGPSFRPFDALKFPANAYVPADKVGPEYDRRTVYRMNVNSGKEPLLDAFDCPDPSVKTPRRGVTTTPLQALGLMNNSFVQRHAGHLAERALRESNQDLAGAVRVAYRLTLGRPPSAKETERALAATRERSLTNVCWALLNSTEFIYVR